MARDPNTPADGKIPQLQQMQTNAPETIIRDCRAAEREIQTSESRKAEGEDFSSGIRERAAERQIQILESAAAAYDSDDRGVGEVSAVCEDQAAEGGEVAVAPAGEAVVADARAAGEVQAFEARGGVKRDVCHAAVLDVFAVGEG